MQEAQYVKRAGARYSNSMFMKAQSVLATPEWPHLKASSTCQSMQELQRKVCTGFDQPCSICTVRLRPPPLVSMAPVMVIAVKPSMLVGHLSYRVSDVPITSVCIYLNQCQNICIHHTPLPSNKGSHNVWLNCHIFKKNGIKFL